MIRRIVRPFVIKVFFVKIIYYICVSLIILTPNKFIMKKIFTLIAAAFVAATVNAQIVYSWSSTGAEASNVTETGGTATMKAGDGSSGDRVNYLNAVNGTNNYTICLNGKKGNIGDNSKNGYYIEIALNEALKGGEVIAFTGYCAKESADPVKASIYMDFNGNNAISSTQLFPNIHPNGPTPEATITTIYETVPAAAAGEKIIRLSRNDAGTNVFITKLQIGDSTLGIKASRTDAKAETEMFDLSGRKVDASAKGIFVINGKKVMK